MQFVRIDQKPLLSTLIQNYLKGEIKHATTFEPNWNGITEALEHRAFSNTQRKNLVFEWSKQYDANSPRQSLINELSFEKTFTVTTGHQLVLASGPAYTIYKIASTIALAKRCSLRFPNFRFIPVFWLASEDHDFEEIKSLHTKAQTFNWERESKGPVGRLSVNDVGELLRPWTQWLIGVGAQATAELVEEAYSLDNLSLATRHLIDGIFKDQELLIFDGDSAPFKTQFVGIVQRELLEQFVFKAMEISTNWLEKAGWSKQVNPREINLFYQTDKARNRIVRDEEGWNVLGMEVKWNSEQLQRELLTSPEKFSSNVVMRPLYQETCLPNIAYLGGPGEVSYWLQLKPVFDAANLPMPVVLMRNSALILGSTSTSRWLKLGAMEQLFTSHLDKELRHLVAQQSLDLEPTKMALREAMLKLKKQLEQLDQTLATAADIELKKQLDGLEVIEKKMAKFIKQKEESKTLQLTKFFEDIQPNGQPQERHFNYLDLQSTWSENLIPWLVQEFDPVASDLLVFMDAGPNKTGEG